MASERAPQTLFEKIWSKHRIMEREDGQVLLYIDNHLVQDGAAPAFEMLRRIPGIHVPDVLVHRLSEAKDKEAEGLQIARELLEGVRSLPGVAGVHLMAPSWEAAIPALLEEQPSAISRQPSVETGGSSHTEQPTGTSR